jgi:hypothetical protein
MAFDWGLKLSPTGTDVKTAANKDVIFTSGARTVRIFASGTTTLNIPNTQNETTVVVFTTYFNNIGEVGGTLADFMPTIVATTIINGTRYISNTPSLFAGGVSPTDFHYLDATNLRQFGQMTRHSLTLGRTISSTKWNTNEDFVLRYYIVGSL